MQMNSGDIGYCPFVGHTDSMIVTWENDTVVDIDCDYRICKHTKTCEMYQRHPVGFVRKTTQNSNKK